MSRFARRATVGALALTVAAACLTGSPATAKDRNQEARAESRSSEQVPGIETAGPIATVTVDAQARLVPEFAPSVLKGDGIAHSPNPVLWPDGVTSGTAITYQVFDISGGEQPGTGAPVWSQSGSNGRIKVSKDLIDGRTYLWRWSPYGKNDWSSAYKFNVDLGSSGAGSNTTVGGVTVALMSGESSVSWESPALAGPSEAIFMRLDWRGRTAAREGLPTNWSLGVGGASSWRSVRESIATVTDASGTSPKFVYVATWGTGGATFKRNSSGLYERVWGTGKPADNISTEQLTRGPDGTGWVLTETSGLTTRFDRTLHAVEITQADKPIATLDWNGDRLMRVTDGIGRTTSVRYAGSDACPSSSWSGWVNPPSGLVCGFEYPTGDVTSLGYVEVPGGAPQLGLIKDPGNTGPAFGWDSARRIAATRSALVNRSAAVESRFASLVSRVRYDKEHHVSAIELAPAEPGGASVTRAFEEPQFTLADAAANKVVQAKLTDKPVSGSATGLGIQTKTVSLESATWQPRSARDQAGLRTEETFDAKGRVSSATDPNRVATTYEYDALGRVESSKTARATTNTKYDADPNGDPWLGMQVSMWPNTNLTGAGSTDSRWRDPLARSYSAAPIGSGPWSARATGVWDIATSKKNMWTFSLEAPSDTTLRFYIDQERCRDACTMELSPGKHQVVLEVIARNPKGAARWSIKGGIGEPELIPRAQIVPNYGVQTTTKVNDTFPGSAANPGTKFEFEQPWTGLPTKQSTPGGLVSTTEYEPNDAANSAWGRVTSTTSPGGSVVAKSYWGNQETATPPDVCEASAAVQAGLLAKVSRQDGSTIRFWYDDHARIAARVLSAPGGKRETTCLTYQPDGTIKHSALYDDSGAIIEESISDDAVGGKPWVSALTVRHGPAHPTSPTTEVTSRTTVDMNGRITEYVDGIGVVTATTYAYDGRVLTQRVTAPNATTPTLRFAFDYDDDKTWPTSMSVNGVTVARMTYDAGTGRVTSVTYSGGTVQTIRYGTDTAPDKLTITKPSGSEYVSLVETNAIGRINSATMRGRDSRGQITETRSFRYDEATRLTDVVVDTASTMPNVPGGKQRFEYGFGPQDASCPSGYPKAGDDALRTSGSRNGIDYVTCHNAQGRTTSTTDPLLTGGKGTATLTHDAFGRVTQIDAAVAESLTWAGGTQLARLIETVNGTSSTTTFDAFNGRTYRKLVDVDGIKHTAKYGYTSEGAIAPIVTLDAANNVSMSQFAIPGGARVSINTTGAATLTINDLTGAEWVNIPLAELTAPGADPTVAPGVARRYGPFGEPLSPPKPLTSALPKYRWHSAQHEETLGDAGLITVMGARPYHALLGEFLAPDPSLDTGASLYGYASADPVNNTDVTGQWEAPSWLNWLLTGISTVAWLASIPLSGGTTAALALSVVVAVADVAMATIQVVEIATRPAEVPVGAGDYLGLAMTAAFTAFGIKGVTKSAKALRGAQQARRSMPLAGEGLEDALVSSQRSAGRTASIASGSIGSAVAESDRFVRASQRFSAEIGSGTAEVLGVEQLSLIVQSRRTVQLAKNRMSIPLISQDFGASFLQLP